MNYQRRDTSNALDALDYAISDLSSVSIDEISNTFDRVQGEFSTLETEVGYILAEHEEMEDELNEWRDTFGSVNEALDAAARVNMYDTDIEQAKARIAQLEDAVTAARIALNGADVKLRLDVDLTGGE